MGEAFSRSWNLVKASWSVLRADKELLLFPFLSMLGIIILAIVFSIPLFLTGLVNTLANSNQPTTTQWVIGGVVLFLFYFVMYTIIIYSNVALVGAAMMRLRGGDPTVSDGFRIANSRLGSILGYAAISATVGVVLNAIRNNDNIFARIFAGLLEFAWNIVTFLVTPVLVIENIGPIDAIKRSTNLLKQTWGEQLIGKTGVGLIFGLIMFGLIILVGLPLIFLGVASGSGIVLGLGIVVLILLIAFFSLISSALNGIFQAALYNYATTGSAGQYFDQAMLVNAFRHKR